MSPQIFYEGNQNYRTNICGCSIQFLLAFLVSASPKTAAHNGYEHGSIQFRSMDTPLKSGLIQRRYLLHHSISHDLHIPYLHQEA